MSLKNLISLGLMATILTVPAANAATLTAQVPTAKVALPTPMTDAELDEVTGEEQHFIPGGKAPLSAGVGRAMLKEARLGSATAAGTSFILGASDGKITKEDVQSMGTSVVAGGVTSGMVGRMGAAVKAADVPKKIGEFIENANAFVSGMVGGVTTLIMDGKTPKKP